MLEELFNLVKSVAGQSVINNPEVPDKQNDAVVAEATNTVASGLRNIVAGGGLQNLLQLFGGQAGRGGLLSNPIVSMMIGHFANKLMNQYNMGTGQANNVATSLIPSVLENLVHKTNDPGNNGFTLDGLLNSITGGQSGQVLQQGGNGGINLNDLLNQSGGDNQGGGLMDMVTQMAQGAQQQQQKNGGSLLDIIKGFAAQR